MIHGSEAADQVVKYSLAGMESALKLSGLAAKNVASYLYSVLSDERKTRGKTHITRMIKEKKQMKIFQLPTDDLKEFAKEAKKYGILFVAMVDKKSPTASSDIMVFSDDAAKVNRILDRMEIGGSEAGLIDMEVEPSTPSRGNADPFAQSRGKPFERNSPDINAWPNFLNLRNESENRASVRDKLRLIKNDAFKAKPTPDLAKAIARPRAKAR